MFDKIFFDELPLSLMQNTSIKKPIYNNIATLCVQHIRYATHPQNCLKSWWDIYFKESFLPSFQRLIPYPAVNQNLIVCPTSLTRAYVFYTIDKCVDKYAQTNKEKY